MSLVTPEEFKQRFFPESRYPSLATIRRHLESGTLAGRRLGKRWFVNVPAFESAGDALLEKVLADVSRAS